ncbi:MAG: hypothetical protein K6T75_08555 [Acetobacteraceae bacterium]|nr:hypothetical protein [Acetobacteraceae bacterium]
MFKTLVNEATVGVRIEAHGPLLIKAPDTAPIDPTLPDSMFVRTWKDGRLTVYIPGSSLKGVVRSHAERLLRTWENQARRAGGSPPWTVPICDPLSEPCRPGKAPRKGRAETDAEGGQTDEERLSGMDAYSRSCPACRTFGNTELAGRLAFSDFYPVTGEGYADPNRTEVRTGVGISRITQAAARGRLYQIEAVVRGAFAGQAHLRNFHLWQLGLLSQVIRDIDEGLVLLGGAKARGFGWVGAAATELSLVYNRGALGAETMPHSEGRLRLWGYADLGLTGEQGEGQRGRSRVERDLLLWPPRDTIELDAPPGTVEEVRVGPLLRLRVSDRALVQRVLDEAAGCLLAALEATSR